MRALSSSLFVVAALLVIGVATTTTTTTTTTTATTATATTATTTTTTTTAASTVYAWSSSTTMANTTTSTTTFYLTTLTGDAPSDFAQFKRVADGVRVSVLDDTSSGGGGAACRRDFPQLRYRWRLGGRVAARTSLSLRLSTTSAPSVTLAHTEHSWRSSTFGCRSPTTHAALNASSWTSVERLCSPSVAGVSPIVARGDWQPPVPLAYAGVCAAFDDTSDRQLQQLDDVCAHAHISARLCAENMTTTTSTAPALVATTGSLFVALLDVERTPTRFRLSHGTHGVGVQHTRDRRSRRGRWLTLELNDKVYPNRFENHIQWYNVVVRIDYNRTLFFPRRRSPPVCRFSVQSVCDDVRMFALHYTNASSSPSSSSSSSCVRSASQLVRVETQGNFAFVFLDYCCDDGSGCVDGDDGDGARGDADVLDYTVTLTVEPTHPVWPWMAIPLSMLGVGMLGGVVLLLRLRYLRQQRRALYRPLLDELNDEHDDGAGAHERDGGAARGRS